MIAVVLAFIISWILLKLGVWAAGDLKIFLGIAAMNPFNPNFLGSLIGISVKSIEYPIFFLEVIVASILLFLPISILIITIRIYSRGLKEKIYSFKKMVWSNP